MKKDIKENSAAFGGGVENKLTIGKTAEVSTKVSDKNTAKAAGSGNLEVFSTPMMIALMENAAYNCAADVLEEGQTTVGTEISVEHTAASPLGAEIIAVAVIESVSGRRIEYTVSAKDQQGEIGRGKHTRVIIDEKRFMSKVTERNKDIG